MAETTLFDKDGKPVAYIEDSDNDPAIYLWSGHAVAYLSDNHVYGFNGNHLGWFEHGIIRDHNGEKIAFIKNCCPKITKIEPIKKIKKIKKIKSIKKIPPIKPINKLSNSSYDFESFLYAGAK